jgi:hypothetical protein
MTKQDEYRRNAAQTIELASRATSSVDKRHLLGLAERWLDLADRAQRQAPRIGSRNGGHPRGGARPITFQRDSD